MLLCYQLSYVKGMGVLSQPHNPENMLTLFVYPEKELIETINKQIFTVRKVTVHYNGNEIPLRTYVPAPEAEITDIELLFVWKNKESPFPMSDALRKSIIYVLTHYHGKQALSFDCYAFANTVAGIPAHKVSEMLNHWDLRGFSSPHVGDTIFFLNQKKQILHHAVIYIGHGLYLSIYGAGGDLEISSFRDTRKGFGVKAKDVLIAVPKSI